MVEEHKVPMVVRRFRKPFVKGLLPPGQILLFLPGAGVQTDEACQSLSTNLGTLMKLILVLFPHVAECIILNL